MFGLGKKKSKEKRGKKNKNQDIIIDPKIDARIHVMPQRFYVAPKKSHTGLIIIIILGLIIIAGLSIGGYYLNENLKKPKTPTPETNQPVSNTNANQDRNTNANQPTVNVNQDINVNVVPPNIEPTSTPTSTEPEIGDINTNANINVNTNTNVNINPNPQPQLPDAPDIDGDGLSALEENLYRTDPVNADSDADAFSDGGELLNGYDPTQPGVQLLDSDLVSLYQHGIYSVIYPSSWRLRELAGSKTDVIFQSSGGEFVEVLIVENSDNLTLRQWHAIQFPQVPLNQVTEVRVKNLNGLLSPDGLTYYLVDPANLGQIYMLIYNTGNAIQKNYATTFNVMVKNFVLSP